MVQAEQGKNGKHQEKGTTDMKKLFMTTVPLAALAMFISSAEAVIKIEVAEVQNGAAFIKGNGARLGAQITWEGGLVTTANKKNGGFSFFGVLPADCVGELSDGNETGDVQVLNCTPVFAGPPAPVPKTGQTLCVDSTGAIDCAGTGQDGDIQAGVALPTPRFTDNGDGTITDNTTGLRWLMDVACLGNRTWTDAFNLVASLNSGTDLSCADYAPGTFSDWRTPNIKELLSLIHYGFFFPAISNAQGNAKWSEGDPFVNLPLLDMDDRAVPIWSSTPVSQGAPNSNTIWAMSPAFGEIHTRSNANLLPVWPVRGPE
jgi:Protein of unknown function (DUF1566)